MDKGGNGGDGGIDFHKPSDGEEPVLVTSCGTVCTKCKREFRCNSNFINLWVECPYCHSFFFALENASTSNTLPLMGFLTSLQEFLEREDEQLIHLEAKLEQYVADFKDALEAAEAEVQDDSDQDWSNFANELEAALEAAEPEVQDDSDPDS